MVVVVGVAIIYSSELTWQVFFSATGAVGVEYLSVDPSKTGDHHHEVVCRRLGVFKLEDKMYMTPVPVWDKRLNARTVVDMPVCLPGEALLEMFKANPQAVLPRHQDPSEYSVPSILQHPIVLEHGIGETIPCTLYSDATPCTVFDSVFSCYLSIAWQRKKASRVILWVLQKSAVCRCGCRGACTFDAINRPIVWSLNMASSGLLPSVRMDGAPWRHNEKTRSETSGFRFKCIPVALAIADAAAAAADDAAADAAAVAADAAGAKLPFHVAVIMYRGDWSESTIHKSSENHCHCNHELSKSKHIQ